MPNLMFAIWAGVVLLLLCWRPTAALLVLAALIGAVWGYDDLSRGLGQ